MDNTGIKNNYWTLTSTELLARLQSGTGGISEDEAAQRLAGLSKGVKAPSQFRRDATLFISQFKSPLVLLLVVAVALSALLGQGSDVAIILFILSATGILSFFQERNAGRAVEKLRSMIGTKVHVLRGGQSREVLSDQIVPGDVLALEAGDILPADCIIIESKDL